MTKTPRTDDAYEMGLLDITPLALSFARKLEQELTEANRLVQIRGEYLEAAWSDVAAYKEFYYKADDDLKCANKRIAELEAGRVNIERHLNLANKFIAELEGVASLHMNEAARLLTKLTELEAENAKLKADAARKEGDWR